MPRPQPCPCCSSSSTTTIRTRRIRTGARLRRHACHGCGYRWSSYTDRWGRTIAPPPPRKPSHAAKPNRRRLTAEQVRLILKSPQRSLVSLAAEVGVSRETVSQVRHGLGYTDVHPRLPRLPRRSRSAPPLVQAQATGPSCTACVHWRGECRMGFPDPELEGPGFAADCALYAAA